MSWSRQTTESDHGRLERFRLGYELFQSLGLAAIRHDVERLIRECLRPGESAVVLCRYGDFVFCSFLTEGMVVGTLAMLSLRSGFIGFAEGLHLLNFISRWPEPNEEAYIESIALGSQTGLQRGVRVHLVEKQK